MISVDTANWLILNNEEEQPSKLIYSFLMFPIFFNSNLVIPFDDMSSIAAITSFNVIFNSLLICFGLNISLVFNIYISIISS